MRKLFGSRYELSLILIAGSFVLLVAIVIGNSMGNKVLGQIASRASFATTPVPIPTPSSFDDAASRVLNRRKQILSVATDPAFPDPRITPEPPPPATPRPVIVATARPKPTPSEDDGGTPDPVDDYTSPPLAVPLVSPTPADQPSVEDSGAPRAGESPAPRQAPARGYPSLPPASGPTP